MSGTIKVGDKAPDFSLPDSNGNTYTLSSHVGLYPIVIFFYPKDNTLICTKEVCAFRDKFNELNKIGNAQVVGISADSVKSHRDFSDMNNLPFPLLSDEDNEVRKLYGAPKTFGLFPGRVTYILDENGILCHIFSSQLNYKAHVKEAITALTKMKGGV